MGLKRSLTFLNRTSLDTLGARDLGTLILDVLGLGAQDCERESLILDVLGAQDCVTLRFAAKESENWHVVVFGA